MERDSNQAQPQPLPPVPATAQPMGAFVSALLDYASRTSTVQDIPQPLLPVVAAAEPLQDYASRTSTVQDIPQPLLPVVAAAEPLQDYASGTSTVQVQDIPLESAAHWKPTRTPMRDDLHALLYNCSPVAIARMHERCEAPQLGNNFNVAPVPALEAPGPMQEICFHSAMQEMRLNPPAAGTHTNSWNQSSIPGRSYGQPTNFTGTAGWMPSNVGLGGLGRPLNGVISSDSMTMNMISQNHGSVGMTAPVTWNPTEMNASTSLKRSWPVYELNQDNIQSKRRKARSCNCKKTKCLTLHCTCFGDSGYCGDDCGCKGCHNNINHAVEVKASRGGILSRDSEAFRPKIMNDGIHNTASKHRKGCNCIKSQCMKEYCECYQGKVGCSARCWCKGCWNPFGLA